MNASNIQAVCDRLAGILEQERELLNAGRAAEVASLIEDKMRALQEFESVLEAEGTSDALIHVRSMVEYIVQMAEENSAHLQAVRNGLRHAIHRIESLNASVHVGSYRAGGTQMSFTNAIGVFNRKA